MSELGKPEYSYHMPSSCAVCGMDASYWQHHPDKVDRKNRNLRWMDRDWFLFPPATGHAYVTPTNELIKQRMRYRRQQRQQGKE